MALNTTNPQKCGYYKKKGHSIEKCWKKHSSLRPKKPKNKEVKKETEKSEISLNSEALEGLESDQEIALSVFLVITF